MPGLAPHLNVLLWGSGGFLVQLKQGYIMYRLNSRHSGTSMVDNGILLNNMKSPSCEYYMPAFCSLTSCSDFPTDQTTPIAWYRIWPFQHYERYPWSINECVACRWGTLTPLDPSFHPLFEICICFNCWDSFSKTCRDFPDF